MEDPVVEDPDTTCVHERTYVEESDELTALVERISDGSQKDVSRQLARLKQIVRPPRPEHTS
jgi:hypothetical protein